MNFGNYKPGRAKEGTGFYDGEEYTKPGVYPVYEPDGEESNASGFNYPNKSFYSYLESVVVSSNAKTLAQPTLLVQEGEKAIVRSGASVITELRNLRGPMDQPHSTIHAKMLV